MTTLTPHGECLLWTPELIWVNAVSDLLISFAFFAIAFVLAYIVYRRRDFQFSYIFWAFALFVSICGMTRLIEVLTIWIPAYVLEAATKGFLAFISVGIAAALLLPLYYLVDATLTLLRRMARREPFWAAHRTHFYQRATDNGFTVAGVVGDVFVLNIGLAVLAGASVVLRSVAADVILIVLGLGAVAVVLRRFSQPRVRPSGGA